MQVATRKLDVNLTEPHGGNLAFKASTFEIKCVHLNLIKSKRLYTEYGEMPVDGSFGYLGT